MTKDPRFQKGTCILHDSLNLQNKCISKEDKNRYSSKKKNVFPFSMHFYASCCSKADIQMPKNLKMRHDHMSIDV